MGARTKMKKNPKSLSIDASNQLMSYKLHTLILVTLLLVMAFSAPVSATEIPVYVDSRYYPYSYEEDGKPMGKFIEILRLADSRIPDFEIKIIPVPWDRGKHYMETGKGVGLVPPYYHGHDWPYLYPYSLALYSETVRAYCREDLPALLEERSWPDGYEGVAVGNVRGYDGWGGLAFHEMVEQEKIQYFTTKSADLLVKLGMTNRFDCLLMEQIVFDTEYRSQVEQFEASGRPYTKLVPGPVTNVEPVYMGYSKPALDANSFPGTVDFKRAFDTELYKMHKQGEIDEIMRR